MRHHPYWVIEHPSRGVLVELDLDGPKFRYSIRRDEGWVFYSKEEAEKYFNRLPEKVRAKSYVLELGKLR